MDFPVTSLIDRTHMCQVRRITCKLASNYVNCQIMNLRGISMSYISFCGIHGLPSPVHITKMEWVIVFLHVYSAISSMRVRGITPFQLAFYLLLGKSCSNGPSFVSSFKLNHLVRVPDSDIFSCINPWFHFIKVSGDKDIIVISTTTTICWKEEVLEEEAPNVAEKSLGITRINRRSSQQSEDWFTKVMSNLSQGFPRETSSVMHIPSMLEDYPQRVFLSSREVNGDPDVIQYGLLNEAGPIQVEIKPEIPGGNKV